MSEKMPIVVRLVTDDIHDDVEYELNLDAGVLSAEKAQPLWPAGSVFWVNTGPRTAAEINAVLTAMTPHAQAMVDAFNAVAELVEEANG